MMTNLFSIFDPATSSIFSLNWLILTGLLVALPPMFWFSPNRVSTMLNNGYFYLVSEFKNILAKTPEALISVVTTALAIFTLNMWGLLPFTFTNFSHMSNTLALALPLWLATFMFSWLHNTSNSLVHLIPNGTPVLLMPFMVVIETISSLIRPITLAIRLAANMVAGHLLISLLMGATALASAPVLPLLISFQTSLMLLELAVAAIQAYVFSVLLTLYLAECNN